MIPMALRIESDMRWVMDQGPDIVEGYVSGSALLKGANAEEVLGAVFLRRNFWETHPQRSRLDCVSVSETTLASFATR